MLRKGLLLFAALLTLAGIASIWIGPSPAYPMIIWGIVLLLATLLERWRYRRREESGSGTWQETGERFVDPETGILMQVWYRSETGERRYTPMNR